MRTGGVAKRCSCGAFWKNGCQKCGRCGSRKFASWGFYVDTQPRGATERRKTVRSGFPTKDAAERELLELVRAVQAGTCTPRSRLTLESYLSGWLRGKTHLRPTTRDTYAILIERYICKPRLRDGHGTALVTDATRHQALLRGARAPWPDVGRPAPAPEGRAQRPPRAQEGPGGRRGGRPHPGEPGSAGPQALGSPPGDEDVDGGSAGRIPRLRPGGSALRFVADCGDHWDASRRSPRCHVARARSRLREAPRHSLRRWHGAQRVSRRGSARRRRTGAGGPFPSIPRR